ncbi:MAG: NmrA-like family protein 1 [Gemmatimonadetes bacterium]|nr:NmrA-like family protein 1 [Gemmatimonadota bacterium]
MAEKRTILVTGATGAQGGSVARHLLRRGEFAVRALTRDAASAKAEALRQAGAEVVQGDLGDPATLRAAVEGCHGVFGVTNFWEHFGGELEHGRNLLDAVAAAGVKHLVLSTLPSVKKITGGALNVPHFDLKAEVEEHARTLAIPATFVHVAFYYENFLHFFPPRRQADGSLGFGFPQGDTPLSGVSVEDVGGVVAPIFDRPDEFIGRTVGIVSQDLRGDEYAAGLARAVGQPVSYGHIPREVFAGFGFPGAEDLADMFEFNRTYIPSRAADVEESRALYPGIRSFEAWLAGNAEQLKTTLGM